MWYHVDVTSRLLLNERRSKLNEKRKDSKGRILKTGESQRKDGIYQYRYTDFRGKRQTVYASTLQELRQKEKEIQKQIDDGIDYEAGQITVIELLEKYISLKKGVRYNTQVGYQFVRYPMPNNGLRNCKRMEEVTAPSPVCEVLLNLHSRWRVMRMLSERIHSSSN